MKLPQKPIFQKPLPYSFDAIEPVLSARAMSIHYNDHHGGYVKKFNKLLREGGSKEDLEFNYSAHILHTLYFGNLAPIGSTEPGDYFQRKVEKNFPNGLEACILKMAEDALKIKGQGWTILLEDRRGRLKIESIPNHSLRDVISKGKPVLILDMWEHAWYLDYQANKKAFVESIMSCINWDVVDIRLTQT